MLYKFNRHFDISYSRVDSFLKLGPIEAFNMAQEMNTEYFKSFGSDNAFLRKKDNAAWVITKTKLSFINSTDWGDSLEAVSSTTLSKGFKTEIQTVFRNNEKVNFVAKQEMCVIDVDKRVPVRLESISYPKDMECDLPAVDVSFFRLKDCLGEDCLVYNDHFRFSDIDYSQHVNNVAYVHYLVDALGRAFFETNVITDFEVQYLHECFEGQAFKVYKKVTSEGCVDLEIRCGDISCIKARILYTF